MIDHDETCRARQECERLREERAAARRHAEYQRERYESCNEERIAAEERAEKAEKERDNFRLAYEQEKSFADDVVARERDELRTEVERLKVVASVRQAGVVHTWAVRLYRAAHVTWHRYLHGLSMDDYIDDLKATLAAAPPSVREAAERDE